LNFVALVVWSADGLVVPWPWALRRFRNVSAEPDEATAVVPPHALVTVRLSPATAVTNIASPVR
jgi:hypothetical protein